MNIENNDASSISNEELANAVNEIVATNVVSMKTASKKAVAKKSALDVIAMEQKRVTDDIAQEYIARIRAQFEERRVFETSQNNTHIMKTLDKSESKLANTSAAKLLLACSVSEKFINRSEKERARFNVYAIEKVADLLASIMFAHKMNAINYNVLRSIFRLDAAQIDFTHKLALASASDKINVDAKVSKMLSRHTVSASTASTQASSTMNALLALNVVSEFKSDNRETAYKLNDNVLTSALRERVA